MSKRLEIDAPRTRGFFNKELYCARAIRESDWRYIMAVLRAADNFTEGLTNDRAPIMDASIALRSHLAKQRKGKRA